MDRQRGDYSDSHRNSHSATTSWPADDPATHRDRNYDNQRGDFSNDGYHFHHQHYRRYDHHHHLSNDRHHYNFNGELNDSSGIGNGNDDIGSGHSGRKRQFSHSGHGASADYNDGGSYVKLYVGAISRTATEDNIRSLFEEHGNIVEIVLLKDKRTGQQQECCFVKYATLEEADRAIGALHNQYTFPGGVVPIKVRYAEGERERLGGFGEKCKLYVGGLNKQALKREVEEIFSPYGLVEDIYVVRDELKQNRGCGFIQFSHRNMAVAAINALNGTYIMRGCDQPLVVRFADPKKPRTGETRCNSRFGGQGFGPRYQEPVVRPAPYLSEPTSGHMLTNSLHPPSPKSVASSSSQGGPIGVIGGPASGTLLGHGLPSSAHQSPQIGSKSQTVSGSCTALELVPPTISLASAVSMSTQTTDILDCDWSEHTCPDGYMYYYNCVTCESRWEKPEEYALYEEQLQKQQQQNHSCQQPHCLSNPLVPFSQPVSQMQSVQPQTTLSNEKLQQLSLSAPEHDHVQVQAATSPVIAPACVQVV